jgi:hypothetical protein
MKKVIRLTESNLIRIVKRVIQEQNDSEGDSTECLKQYIDFLFEPTDFDKDGYPVDGGDLGLWNNNKIPNLNDEEAYNRFIKHLEYCHNDVGIYDDDACENITLEDMIPLAKNLYRNKITNTSNSEKNPDDNFYKLIIGLYSKNGQTVPINIRRRMSNFSVIESINQTMIDNPPNEFDDEFEYADNILNWTAEIYYPYLDEIDSMDEIIDFMKEEYSDIIFDNFYSQE